MSLSPNDAADALAALKASQARLAQAAECPPQRHAAFAAIMGCFVALPVLSDMMMLMAEVVLLPLMALVIIWDRRRTGMFINGYRRGRTRPLAFTLLALMLVMLALSYWFSRGLDMRWASLVLAVVAAAIGYAFSRQWQRVFRREMGVAA